MTDSKTNRKNDKSRIVWVLTIVNRSETISAYDTLHNARWALYNYCVSQWSNKYAEEYGELKTVDMDEVFEAYFSHPESITNDEWYEFTQGCLEILN